MQHCKVRRSAIAVHKSAITAITTTQADLNHENLQLKESVTCLASHNWNAQNDNHSQFYKSKSLNAELHAAHAKIAVLEKQLDGVLKESTSINWADNDNRTNDAPEHVPTTIQSNMDVDGAMEGVSGLSDLPFHNYLSDAQDTSKEWKAPTPAPEQNENTTGALIGVLYWSLQNTSRKARQKAVPPAGRSRCHRQSLAHPKNQVTDGQ